MRVHILLSIFFGVLASCRPSGNIQIPEGSRIKSTPDGRMYFTNVRGPFYAQEDKPEAKMHVWRLKAYDTSVRNPQLLLAIYDAWEREESYLIPEPNMALGIEGFDLELAYSNGKRENIFYRPGRPSDASRFVIQLYNAQREKARVLLQGSDLFGSDELTDFQKVCEDYLHLIQR